MKLTFNYDKLHLKEITVLMPKYHTNVNSFLTPILGLYGINVKDFVNEFENKTKFITADIVIPLRVKISKIKTFEIYFQTPYISSIIRDIENINILTIYKISLIKSVRMFDNNLSNIKKNYISIRKYLSFFIKNIEKPAENINLSQILPYFIRKNQKKLLIFDTLLKNEYGVFVNFNNSSSFLRERIKFHLSPSNIDFRKLTIRNSFKFNDVYYLSSNRFDIFTKLPNLFSSNSYSFFPLFYRYRRNIIPINFLNKISTEFKSRRLPTIVTPNVFKLLLLMNVIFLKPTKLIYANISSTPKNP